MTGPDFDHFCALAVARSGLVLGPDKAYLVQSRLEPIARELGLAGAPALLSRLRAGAAEALVRRCVDAMATHESLFFRDGSPFDQLEAVLPQLAAARPPGTALKAWCAACSTGQEPYSLAMLAGELAPRLGASRLQIVATDMCEGVLAKARAGAYSDFEARRGLSPERRARWFQPVGDGVEASPELKRAVDFRPHNLLDGALPGGPYDLIFCRNVLIYFDRACKAKVLERLAQALQPDGLLFLGCAESPVGLCDALEPVAPGRPGYRRRPPAAAATHALARAG